MSISEVGSFQRVQTFSHNFDDFIDWCSIDTYGRGNLLF